MIKIIIERGLYDQEYVGSCVSGLEELFAAVKDFDPEYVSRRTDVAGDLLERAAEMFAAAERVLDAAREGRP